MNPAISKWFVRLFWIVPLSFYFATACRWPGWIDAPMIAGNVYALKFDTWVNTHNLFHLLGRVWTLLFPWGELHARLNYFCAFLGAVTVYFLFLTGRKITKNDLAATAGAVAVMFGHSLWWHSTILEVYTLNTALLAVCLYLIASFEESGDLSKLYGAVFVFGLACSNHVLMGLFVFAFLVLPFVPSQGQKIRKPRVLFAIAAAFLMGFSLYLLLFFQEFNRRILVEGSSSWKGYAEVLRPMIDAATGGHFKNHMFPVYMSAKTKWNWRLNYVFLLFMNYPSVAFLAGWAGLVAFARRKAFRFTFVFFAVGLIAQVIWSSNYLIWDMYAFALPVWVLFGFAVILGFDVLLRSKKAVRVATLCLLPTLLVGPIVYARIPVWAQTNGFWKNYFSFFDYVSNLWDPSTYFANPNKRRYDDVERISRAVFEKLPQGAHLYDDDGKGFYPLALYYQAVLKERPDIRHHVIFGPELNNEVAARVAQEMADNLERGESVFVSSPYWPERPALNQLYMRLASPELAKWVHSMGGPDRLPVERFERTFPRYELKRIPLIDGKPFYIYQFVLRDSSH